MFDSKGNMTTVLCALCATDANGSSIVDGERSFCCSGCQAVYSILSAQNMLAHYQDTPLFKQAVRYGLISNPDLIEQIRHRQASDEETEKLYFEIEDMWCPSCAEVIKLVLSQEQGVKCCVVDYSTDLAAIEYHPKWIARDHLFQLIKNLGYQPVQRQFDEASKVNKFLAIRLCIAAFCAMNVMMFSYPLYATYFDDGDHYGSTFAWLSLIFSLPVLAYSFAPVFKRFFNSFRVGIYGMETLVMIGVLSSFFLSLYELFRGGTRVYFDSMTVIIVFVLLGKVIESKAKFSAKESLFRLNRSLPKRGRKRFADNTASFVAAKEIIIGDTLIALAGEKIILDGVVIEGEGACDESSMTGESLPISKTVGSRMLSGTVLQNGWIAYRVTATAEHSTLQKIVDMVAKDINLKVHYGHYVDHIVRWFVPVVIVIALLATLVAYFLNGDLEAAIIRGISVLLISCPCAIGIAAPLAESQMLQSLAGMGAVVRNRGCLRLLGKETVFVFDKTGTITDGQFTLINAPVQAEILGSLAAQSTHPMSLAIARACPASRVAFSRIREHAGKGISGIYLGDEYFLGSREFLQSQGIHVPEQIVQNGIISHVYFARGKVFLATLALKDQIREDAPKAVAALKPAPAILLSGDSREPVQNVAEQCGFSAWYAQQNPLQKREIIEDLRSKGNIVCMLGDGINDALALTRAHIGVSVVNATDISIQVSDILLTTHQLETLPKIRTLAIRGRRIMHQNLFWAFFYNVIGMGLAFFGLLSPIFAAFAMVASSLMVVANARRIS